MTEQSLKVYEFGPFRLDTTVRRLSRDGRPISLTSKIFDMLLLLVKKRGQLVTKEELMEELWPDRFVEQNNLTVHMTMLRKILGERHRDHKYIETVQGRGYRFVARVREVEDENVDESSEAVVDTASRTAVEQKDTLITSIAVLPFVNTSQDSKLDYLSDGLTASIINILSQIPQLRVMARSTVFRYKGRDLDGQAVGLELGVGAVLEGRVLQLSDRLIISVELVRALDGVQLWGEQYNRPPSDIFAVQEEIARELTGKLRLKITGAERKQMVRQLTDNIDAFHLYLKGSYFWSKRTPEDIRKGMKYFNRAIKLDKNYALAYAGLADCYSGLAIWNERPPRKSFPKAKQAVTKALEIDETLAEAHNALAVIREFYDWDFEEAENEYLRSLDLNPNSVLIHRRYAGYLSRMARHEEAIEQIKQAKELDPLSSNINMDLGGIYYYARQYNQAIEQCRETLEIDPNFGGPYILISLALLKKGKYEEAIAEAQKAQGLLGDNPDGIAHVGYAYAVAGRREAALEILNELLELSSQKYIPPYLMAYIYAGLKLHDLAFEWLEKAYEERSYVLVGLKALPLFDDLREDPRFSNLLQRVGLVT
ncbi:MAG: winged helix-turn-helix domain-containing protein [Pyrinomonadaceae bacterium]|nr:winged helix-turn-helix domain-containing protein [Pyrinomonadaceae bacterium]